jgi:hypothetical protein
MSLYQKSPLNGPINPLVSAVTLSSDVTQSKATLSSTQMCLFHAPRLNRNVREPVLFSYSLAHIPTARQIQLSKTQHLP